MTALARLRERGDREAVGEGSADGDGRKQPLTPGFAVPSPLGEGCYQLGGARVARTRFVGPRFVQTASGLGLQGDTSF